jgi:hypothetical protein
MGGMAWHHLQYVAGLSQLGHEVYFVEDSDDYDSCYHPATLSMDRDPTYGLRFVSRVFKRLGLSECWAYYDAHLAKWHGPQAKRIVDLCRKADVLLNVSGVNPMRPWFMNIPARAFIDTDPAFTQTRHLTEPHRRELAEKHTVFFSFGENIGRNNCTVPSDGISWQATRQPVVLSLWPSTPGPTDGKFTTVMQWDSYRAQKWDGGRYGMKSESFEDYFDLAQRTGAAFELLLSGPAPHDQLRARGWNIRQPHRFAGDPWTYQRYIRRSKAEFSVAKHGYVVSQCGWFSERSALYLASGRPVILQDTGYTNWLPSGYGVVAFHNLEEACDGIKSVSADYKTHCQRARELVEEFFDSKKVLTSLIARALRSSDVTAI